MSLTANALDLVEELRLRRWARENYAPPSDRADDWHAVVYDEMSRRDLELAGGSQANGSAIVPLVPADFTGEGPHTLRGPLTAIAGTRSVSELHYG